MKLLPLLIITKNLKHLQKDLRLYPKATKGVKNAIQYTIPIEKALNSVRNCEDPKLSTREKHLRECFVVVEDGADKERIRNEIVNMPAYFAPYDTTVTFITQEELNRDHAGIPHGGFVIRTGKTGAV